MTTPVNNDLSYANGIPGWYVKIDLGAGGASDDTLKRLIILAQKTAAGTAPANVPTLVTSQSQADQGTGPTSDAARLFAAATSQLGAGALQAYICPIVDPAGQAAAYQLSLSFSSVPTALNAGVVNIWIAGRRISVGVLAGDDAPTIVSNLYRACKAMTSSPVTGGVSDGAVTGDTLVLTYAHVGAQGEDLPIRVSVQGVSNLLVSPGYHTSGTLVFAANASAAGHVILTVGEATITVPILSGSTPTATAAALEAAILAGGYPVTCGTHAAGVLDLYYGDGRVVRRITCKVVKNDGTANGTTVNGVTAGSPAYIGTATSSTPGSGTPDLTAALVAIAAQPAFGAWVHPWTDPTTLGTLATQLTAQGDGYKQKDQVQFIGSAGSLTDAGGVPRASTPMLTADNNAAVAWQPGAAQQAMEQAARLAAIYLGGSNYVAQNFDGWELATKSATVPLMAPDSAAAAGDDDINAAIMTYGLTPLVTSPTGVQTVVRAMTTMSTDNADLKELPVRKQLAFGRIQVRATCQRYFTGKNFKANSGPKTPNCFGVANVRTAIFELLLALDNQDLYDGAVKFKDAISAEQDATVKTRINVFVPWAVMRAIHQGGVVLAPQ